MASINTQAQKHTKHKIKKTNQAKMMVMTEFRAAQATTVSTGSCLKNEANKQTHLIRTRLFGGQMLKNEIRASVTLSQPLANPSQVLTRSSRGDT